MEDSVINRSDEEEGENVEKNMDNIYDPEADNTNLEGKNVDENNEIGGRNKDISNLDEFIEDEPSEEYFK